MKFLEEIVDYVLEFHGKDPGQVTIVFPNRRAGLFFQKYLTNAIDQSIWSPRILDIEVFITELSRYKAGDPFEMIYELFRISSDLTDSKESFERFYYWGNVLLQDFDEIDRFMIDPKILFSNLLHIKQLENSLEYLTDEQQKLIKEFWESFGTKRSGLQKGFLSVWDNLFNTYQAFNDTLKQQGLVYKGMMYREVASELKEGELTPERRPLIFGGFNALSSSEEKIISWFVENHGAKVFWDADDFYFKDMNNEAGYFLREMKFRNPSLQKSFKSAYGNRFRDSNRKWMLTGVASTVGQAQEASRILSEQRYDLDERTAIVLPNSNLLFPVLHALPDQVSQLNVTMGYPLSESIIAEFLQAILKIQEDLEKKGVMYFRNVLQLIRHPFLAGIDDDLLRNIEEDIIKQNRLWISQNYMQSEDSFLSRLFELKDKDLANHLSSLVRDLAMKSDDPIEKEFFFQFYKLINRLQDFLERRKLPFGPASFRKLLKQVLQFERLPFEGEPLSGLQIMGILETRNLDFDNVIVLSVNEGQMPPAPRNISFIPHSIRKAFDLPTLDQQDAIYAYIFYRMIQRSKNVHFIYNASEQDGNTGEVSRFIKQLEFESDTEIIHKTVSHEIKIEEPNLINVSRSSGIQEKLLRYTATSGMEKRLTPTAINTYLDCSLRFYFKYVLELKEEDEIAEEVDPMVFGNILHKVMEDIYQPLFDEKAGNVQKSDINNLRSKLDEEIERQFKDQFGADEKSFRFEGNNVIAREIIKKMANKILDYDETRTPFTIVGLEADEKKGFKTEIEIRIDNASSRVGLKGIIDRIEEKDGIIRVIDYKTGRDEKSFNDVDSLFDRENEKRNKAVFQILLYGYLAYSSLSEWQDAPIQVSLFNIRDLFSDGFSPLIQIKDKKSTDILDIRPLLPEFIAHLKTLLEEMFNPEIAFSQTDDLKKCRYCAYVGICNR